MKSLSSAKSLEVNAKDLDLQRLLDSREPFPSELRQPLFASFRELHLHSFIPIAATNCLSLRILSIVELWDGYIGKDFFDKPPSLERLRVDSLSPHFPKPFDRKSHIPSYPRPYVRFKPTPWRGMRAVRPVRKGPRWVPGENRRGDTKAIDWLLSESHQTLKQFEGPMCERRKGDVPDFKKLTHLEYLNAKSFTFFHSITPSLSSLTFHDFPQSTSKQLLLDLPPSLKELIVLKTDIPASVFTDRLEDGEWLPKLKTLRISFPDSGTPPNSEAPRGKGKPTTEEGIWADEEREALEAAAEERNVKLKLARVWTKKWVLVDVDDERFVEHEDESEDKRDDGYLWRM